MKPNFPLLIAAVLALTACDKLPLGLNDHADHAHADKAAGHGDDHGPAALSITHFTDRTELFAEFPTLIVGTESRFAAHLTWTHASGFKAVTEGRAVVILSGGNQPEERFAVEAPGAPGIFRPVAKPAHAGKRQLALVLETKAGSIAHALGDVVVYPDRQTADAATAKEEEGGEIAYLKEQQWKTDYATSVVDKRNLRESIAVPATLRAAAGGEALIAAPASGVLSAAGPQPHIGQAVRKGEVVAYLVPRLGGEADMATLELATRRARISAEQAKRDRERLESLLAQEAVPERRVIEARSQERLALAELDAAQARSAMVQGGAGGVPLRAPLAGVLADVKVAPGGAVEAGQALFHIANFGRLWLEARIPESQVGRIRDASGAWFRPEGADSSVELEVGRNAKLIAYGSVVDKETRSVPLVFEFDNSAGRLKLGQSITANVVTERSVEALVIPVSAVIDDGGQAVVYVLKSGEAFVRRAVTLGVRDGEFVAVTTGLATGERVVSRGAYQVKLAATAPAAIGHGHAH